jgi:hypothetical protein
MKTIPIIAVSMGMRRALHRFSKANARYVTAGKAENPASERAVRGVSGQGQ